MLTSSAGPASDEKTPIVPVPEDAPPMRFRLPPYGAPTQSWLYTDAQSRPMCYITRFDYTEDGEAKKVVLPVTYCQLPDGKRGWRAKGLPGLRPLYNLPEIVRTSEGADPPKVIICEGEKAADAAGRLFPDCVCTTPMHGAQSPHKTDWSPLAGRTVVIVPDADKPGRDFAKDVAALLIEAGAETTELLPPTWFSGTFWENGKPRSRHWSQNKKGYDLADAVADGWTAERIKAQGNAPIARYSDRCVDELRWTEVKTYGYTFRFDEDVVEVSRTDKEGDQWWEPISSRIVPIGYARTTESEDWQLLVMVRDPDGRDKRLIIATGSFAGDGRPVREALLSAGGWTAQGRQAREAQLTYLSKSVPPLRVLSVPRPGWHGECFVLPGQGFGVAQDEEYVVGDGSNNRYDCGGTLDGWKADIARPALGNSRLVFALSLAFVGPLLKPLGAESGIFHLVGASSSGKSLAQKVAASVWGKGDTTGFVQTWRQTDNALEYVAEAHTDAFLVLDELGQADPHKVGEIAYMLAQNEGKGRSASKGGLAATPQWRIAVLSSGEVGLEDVIEASGPGKRAKAGQALRFVTVPADAGRGMGIFEALHECATSTRFWEHLNGAAQAHYGHASRTYVTALTKSADFKVSVQRKIDEFVMAHCDDQAHGQIRRVAAKFGLVAAAGELAASFDILPWPEGAAFEAASTCFQAWRDARGGNVSEEEREALRAVRGFIEAHGASRFEVIDDRVEIGLDRHVLNRAGFRRRVDDLWEYYVLPEGWRAMCHGMDSKMVARTLRTHGLLEVGESGRLQKNMRLPGIAGTTRCYVLRSNLLADPDADNQGP